MKIRDSLGSYGVTEKNKAGLLIRPCDCAATEIATCSLPSCYPETHNQEIQLSKNPVVNVLISKSTTE